MRVLLTGGGGFIGHHALRYFINNTDWEIVATDSFRHLGTTSRLRETINSFSEIDQKRIKVVIHDLSLPIDNITASEFGEIDIIINYASLSDVDDSILTPVPFIKNNIDLAINMFEYARSLKKLKTFIHVSTDEVYGPLLSELPHNEHDSFNPSNPYSASKVGQEAIANAYWKTYDLPIIIINSMNIFGERQYEKSFIPKAILYLINNKKVPVHVKYINNIMQVSSRCYMYADNQSNAIHFIIEKFINTPHRASNGLNRIEKFNVCGDTIIKNDDLVFKIADILNIDKNKIIEYIDPADTRPGLDIRYGLSSNKLHSIGWKENISFDNGLEKTVKWFLDNKIWL